MENNNKEMEEILDQDGKEIEHIRQTILSQAKSLRFEMEGPNWKNWYDGMHAQQRIEEDNFWDFQKGCYHTLLARYTLAEERNMMLHTQKEIIELFGEVDKEMLTEKLDEVVEDAKEGIKAWKEICMAIKDALEPKPNLENIFPKKEPQLDYWSRPNSY